MLLLRAVLYILVMNASPRGPMCFRFLRFSLSGPCELLFFLYCLLDMRSGECDVVSLYVLCYSINGSVCFVCCVFHQTIHNMFGCVCYFVVEYDGVVECGWIDYVWSSKECVCCACVSVVPVRI